MARAKKRPQKTLRMVRVQAYRSKATGRFITRKASREVASERVRMDFQQGSRGRFVRGYEVLSRKTTIKTAQVANSGPNAGLIDWALFATNVTTRLKDARRFEITLVGRDTRGKHRRIRHVIHTGKASPDKLTNYLIAGILGALRQRGWRTQYDIETATYRAPGSSKSRSRRLRPLHDVEIQVRVIKK